MFCEWLEKLFLPAALARVSISLASSRRFAIVGNVCAVFLGFPNYGITMPKMKTKPRSREQRREGKAPGENSA